MVREKLSIRFWAYILFFNIVIRLKLISISTGMFVYFKSNLNKFDRCIYINYIIYQLNVRNKGD